MQPLSTQIYLQSLFEFQDTSAVHRERYATKDNIEFDIIITQKQNQIL